VHLEALCKAVPLGLLQGQAKVVQIVLKNTH
jgi:hypothetical protein